MPKLKGKKYAYTTEGIAQYKKDKERMGKAVGNFVEGDIDSQMDSMMDSGEEEVLADEKIMSDDQLLTEPSPEDIEAMQDSDPVMEDKYLDYVIKTSLTPEDEQYLLSALEDDDRLSELFDKVMITAGEFTGSGIVEGPGSEVSDSIPARLSNGEFVITAKATEEIGPDVLEQLMSDAEGNADRKLAQTGGYVEKADSDKEDADIAVASSEVKMAGKQPLEPISLQDEETKKAMMLQNPRYGIAPS